MPAFCLCFLKVFNKTVHIAIIENIPGNFCPPTKKNKGSISWPYLEAKMRVQNCWENIRYFSYPGSGAEIGIPSFLIPRSKSFLIYCRFCCIHSKDFIKMSSNMLHSCIG